MMIIPTKQNFFDRNSQSHHKKRWKLFWKTFLFHPESLKSSYAQFSFFKKQPFSICKKRHQTVDMSRNQAIHMKCYD